MKKPNSTNKKVNIAISVKNMSKSFAVPTESRNSIKNLFISAFKKNEYNKLNILKDINFEIEEGEFFGVVGRNGSGKSTLLKLLAGIYTPDRGSIDINGKLTPFIELGVGFNPELTGKENVYLNGALLGFSRKEMSKIYDKIVDFAELHEFMDQKLKNYSSGMQVRLAFSIAIRAESEILLLDEVLAVGDTVFQKKCFNYFKELKKRNRTVIFISHDTGNLLEYCSRGILIDHGEIKSEGNISDVINDYLDLLNNEAETKNRKDNKSTKSINRWGIGGIEIKSIATSVSSNIKDSQQTIFTDEDKNIVVNVVYKASKKLGAPIYGITIHDASGQNIFASNTLWQNEKTKPIERHESISVEWVIPNVFNNGRYYISPAVSDSYGSTIYDWRENMIFLDINKKIQTTAIINADNKITINEKVG